MAHVWCQELQTQFKDKVACLRVYALTIAFVGAGARPNLSATAEAEYVSRLVRWIASLLHQRVASIRVVADPAEVGNPEVLH
jgi:hypothetical protein